MEPLLCLDSMWVRGLVKRVTQMLDTPTVPSENWALPDSTAIRFLIAAVEQHGNLGSCWEFDRYESRRIRIVTAGDDRRQSIKPLRHAVGRLNVERQILEHRKSRDRGRSIRGLGGRGQSMLRDSPDFNEDAISLDSIPEQRLLHRPTRCVLARAVACRRLQRRASADEGSGRAVL